MITVFNMLEKPFLFLGEGIITFHKQPSGILYSQVHSCPQEVYWLVVLLQDDIASLLCLSPDGSGTARLPGSRHQHLIANQTLVHDQLPIFILSPVQFPWEQGYCVQPYHQLDLVVLRDIVVAEITDLVEVLKRLPEVVLHCRGDVDELPLQGEGLPRQVTLDGLQTEAGTIRIHDAQLADL